MRAQTIRTCAVLTFVVGVAAVAAGQYVPTSPHLDLPQRGAFLLSEPSVQQKIGLTSQQRQGVTDRFVAYSRQQAPLLTGGEAKKKAMIALDRSTSDSLLGLLTSPQRTALRKLTFEAAGYHALTAPDVVAKLKLKPAQVTKIEKILDTAAEPEEDLESVIARRKEEAANDKEREEIEKSYGSERKARAAKRADLEAKSLTVLTPAQRKLWTSLKS